MKTDQKVSVVLLTKNSAVTVRKALESIFNQTRMPDEVVVVDGNSKDGTLKIVKEFPVKIVSEPGAGFGHARNVGVENAAGDIVSLLTPTVTLSRTGLRRFYLILISPKSRV